VRAVKEGRRRECGGGGEDSLSHWVWVLLTQLCCNVYLFISVVSCFFVLSWTINL
jgi:hypothetical protein